MLLPRLVDLGLRDAAGRARLVGFAVCLVADALADTAAPLLFRRAVDDGLVRLQRDVALAWTWAGLASTLLAAGSSALGSWFGSLVSVQITYQLRCDVFRSMVRRPVDFYSQSKAGELVSRISGDASDAQSLIQVVLGTIVGQTLTFGLALAGLVYLDPMAALVALLAAPLLLAPLRPIERRLHEAGNRQAAARSQLNHHMTEQLNVPAAVGREILGTHTRVESEFQRIARDIQAAARLRNINFFRSSFLLNALSGLGVTSVYLVASVRVGSGPVSIGDVIAQAGLVALLYRPLTQIAMQGIGLVPAMVAVDRVFEIIDYPSGRREGYRELDCRVTSLDFDHVWFRHTGPEATAPSLRSRATDTGEWTISDVSMTLTPGVTALVGVTGSGKSTLAMLASGVYLPTTGRVTVNGTQVHELTREPRNELIGVLTQDALVLHASVRENLALYRPDATDDDMLRVLDQVCLGDTIRKMPDSLSSTLGDRGYRLSGGERQRLALARILLGKPQILIMDEATAHLDPATEHTITSAIEQMSPDVIRLVIAHRLSTIRNADQILVIDRGRVVERGTHDELVAAGRAYANLLRQGGSSNEVEQDSAIGTRDLS
ncbi:Putative multidrug export ATP-binding/permease protein [Aestuariimicrobium sp. T2.26MG-19.2B]|nr:Putative multidrug export ATP-binding/permease protein [Aestuariimicrobium sp. T2.26MG-19.2B]